MNTLDFCNWLSGFFELADVQRLDSKTVTRIKEKLEEAKDHRVGKSWTTCSIIDRLLKDKTRADEELTQIIKDNINKALAESVQQSPIRSPEQESSKSPKPIQFFKVNGTV